MSDETKTPETEVSEKATAAGAKPEEQDRLYTKEEMTAAVLDRLERYKRSLAKESKAPTDPPKEESKPTQDPALKELQAKVAFGEALEELEWKPSKADRDMLREAFLTSGKDFMDRMAVRIKPTEAAAAPAPTQTSTPTYKSPGAPAGAPAESLEMDATKWSRDGVDRMQSDGTFLDSLKKYRSSLPGGGDGLFRKRVPVTK